MAAVIGILLYLAAVVFFFMFATIPVVAVAALAVVVTFAYVYVQVLAQVLVMVPSPAPAPRPYPPPRRDEEGTEPAHRQYLFGQAQRDLLHVVRAAARECRRRTVEYALRISRDLFQDDAVVFVWPLGVLLFAGLGLGVLVGGVATGLIAAVHLAFTAVLLAVGGTMIYLLRGVESALQWVRGIRVHCPACYHRVLRPRYACPGCGVQHRDVLPGRYGVFRRTCACGRTLPTLLLFGRHAMQAYCQHCDRSLADRAGTAGESVLPVFGAPAAGKTRLLLAMVMVLVEHGTRAGAVTGFADEDTRHRYDRLRPALMRGQPTRGTLPELPRAYSLYIEPAGRGRRLVHLFDAAGERYGQSERLQELRYMRLAASYVFVLDPLSVQAFWDSLPEPDRERLAAHRATMPPEFVFQQTLQNIEAMQVRTRRARLAVVVSKLDLVRDAPIVAGLAGDSGSIESWMDSALHLGNLLRTMRHNFGDIRFFCTSAVLDADDTVDSSIDELVGWAVQGAVGLRRAG